MLKRRAGSWVTRKGDIGWVTTRKADSNGLPKKADRGWASREADKGWATRKTNGVSGAGLLEERTGVGHCEG